ncbi:MAG: hypothetical protein MZV63_19650, partial [Marinilabiliales bacterium]|nr:hypothetical protein [Marinilabiliales bacterium]
ARRGHVEPRDGAVRVVAEPLDGDRAREAAAARQCAVVIEEVRVSREVDDAGVVREAAALRRHDDSAVGPGAGGAGTGGVGDALRDRAAREHHVVEAVALEEPGGLLVRGRPSGVAPHAEALGGHVTRVGLPEYEIMSALSRTYQRLGLP